MSPVRVEGNIPEAAINQSLPDTVQDGAVGTFLLGKDIDGSNIIVVVGSDVGSEDSTKGLSYAITSERAWVRVDSQTPAGWHRKDWQSEGEIGSLKLSVINPTNRGFYVEAKSYSK